MRGSAQIDFQQVFIGEATLLVRASEPFGIEGGAAQIAFRHAVIGKAGVPKKKAKRKQANEPIEIKRGP